MGYWIFEDNPDDRIIKIEFAQNLANRSPTARVGTNVQSGLAPLTIEFEVKILLTLIPMMYLVTHGILMEIK